MFSWDAATLFKRNEKMHVSVDRLANLKEYLFTVRQVFRLVVLQLVFQSKERPLMWCDHCIMVYRDKRPPIDHVERVPPLRQHLKK